MNGKLSNLLNVGQLWRAHSGMLARACAGATGVAVAVTLAAAPAAAATCDDTFGDLNGDGGKTVADAQCAILAAEGLLLAIAPERLERLLDTMREIGPEKLRYAGLAAAVAGTGILLLVR